MPWVPYDRVRNNDWKIWQNDEGTYSKGDARDAVLMDIRQELRNLNRILGCSNFLAVPATLRQIARNTTKRKRKVTR